MQDPANVPPHSRLYLVVPRTSNLSKLKVRFHIACVIAICPAVPQHPRGIQFFVTWLEKVGNLDL